MNQGGTSDVRRHFAKERRDKWEAERIRKLEQGMVRLEFSHPAGIAYTYVYDPERAREQLLAEGRLDVNDD